MHSIWAIARNTLAQAMRMKIAVVVIALLVILLPIMSMVIDGDGTLVGKLQTFTSYGLGLISFLLCILTIAVSTFTLSNDLKRRYIFLVITKPLKRTELVLGKMLGVFLFNLLLVVVFSVILYVCTVLIPRIDHSSEEQRTQAETEFFTSRVGIRPEVDKEQIQKQAMQRYEELKSTGQLPEGMSYTRIISELFGQERMKQQKVDPGEIKEWEFENVRFFKPDRPDQVLFVRYKFRTTVTPPDERVHGAWRIGDIRQYRLGVKSQNSLYGVERTDSINTMHEFEVPANAVTPDGYLGLGLLNDPSMNQTTIIPENLEILYETGTFTGNYLRAILLILLQLMFLAILGVSASTWLSFPVAILVCLVVYAVGLVNGFILDAIGGLGQAIGLFYSLVVRPLVLLFPKFDGAHSPGGYIVEARTLKWMFLLSTGAILILVKGLAAFLTGLLIFSRREVGKSSA